MHARMRAWATERHLAIAAPIAVVWLFAVIAGFSFLTNYGLQTIETAAAAPLNPVTVGDEDGRAMLILAAHPKCPCTVATVNELARTMTKVKSLRVRIALYLPPDEPESWAKAGVWRAAAQIPNVEFEFDRQGALARSLGAQVSGHAFLFDDTGQLLFNGGLTSARGHEGASVGTHAIISWLNNGSGASTAPIFGCLIFADGDVAIDGGAI